MTKLAIIIASAVALSACASGYTTSGWTGEQTPKWRDVDVLEVVSKGNAYTSSKKLTRMTLLRAAETAIESDFRYFIEIGEENAGRSTTVYMPQSTTSYTSGSITGNHYSGYGTSYTSGGPMTFNKPGVNALYKMFTELPPDARPGQFYDAYEVYNELGPKYIDDFEPKHPK